MIQVIIEDFLTTISTVEFLKLQDLTINLSKPCVLDMKMGVFFDLEKKASQIKKITNSTSATLGYRICGLFVNSHFVIKLK